MTEDSIKDLALYKLNAETYQEKYHQTEYEKEKFREEARLSKNQLELTEKALKDANEKNKVYEDKIKTLESSLHTYELLKHRSQAAVIGLQKVARESQDNVIQLETRLRNLTVNQNSEQEQLRNMVKESNEFRLELGRRIGLSDTKADFNDLMGKITQLLDEAALFEFKYIQSESNLKRAITELDTLKQSTQGMTKRSEDYLQERKVQSEKINLLEAKNEDLLSQLTLLKNMSQAKETIIKDLQKQLEELGDTKKSIEEKSKQTTFKLQIESAQMKALLTSLAASLSTIDKPCEPTEIGVKESVARCLDQIAQMREAGNNFQNKVLELQNQFEAQHKAGLAVNAELKQARERVQQAETDCAQMQSELTGLRLLHKQDQTFKENVTSLMIQLCEYLGIQIKHEEVTPSEMISACLDRIEHLLNRGCLPWVCVQSSEIRDHHHFTNHEPPIPHQHCLPKFNNTSKCLHDIDHHQSYLPSRIEEYECDHKQVEYLIEEVIRHKGDLSFEDWQSIENLCKSCSGKLMKIFCNQLSELFGQISEMHKTNIPNPNCSDHILAKLQQELEAKELELSNAKSNFESVKEDKDKQIDDLNKTIVKLNTSSKIQTQRLEKLQKLVEHQNSKSQSKQEAFKMAKSLLVDAHNKKKTLGTFRDLVGRMLDVDTRFTPNPDMIIFQRIQQLLDFAVSNRMSSLRTDTTTSFMNNNSSTFYPVLNSLTSPNCQLNSTTNLALPLWEQTYEDRPNLQLKSQGKPRPSVSNGTTRVQNEKKPAHSQIPQDDQQKKPDKCVPNTRRKSIESRIQKDDRQY
ncbi:unnamed protein product [Trichobilharzia szidati]|nr:unnamed protein product [Trichobilharzia szidati]